MWNIQNLSEFFIYESQISEPKFIKLSEKMFNYKTYSQIKNVFIEFLRYEHGNQIYIYIFYTHSWNIKKKMSSEFWCQYYRSTHKK